MSVIRCLPIFILSTHSLKWETRKPSKAPSHKPKRFHIDVAFLTSELIKWYTRPFVRSIWKHVAKGLQMSNIHKWSRWNTMGKFFMLLCSKSGGAKKINDTHFKVLRYQILYPWDFMFEIGISAKNTYEINILQGPSPPNTLPMRFHIWYLLSLPP